MKLQNLLEAEQEAKRFLCKLKDVKQSETNGYLFRKHDKRFDFTKSSKETGALKRSSLDLTRSLSKLRNDTY